MELFGAWWQKAQQLDGLPYLSGAVPAAGRAGSTPESWGTNLHGAWVHTGAHSLEHSLFGHWESISRCSPWPTLSMKDECEWEVWCSQSRQPLLPWGRQVKLWCLCILPLYYCQEMSSATEAANPVPPLEVIALESMAPKSLLFEILSETPTFSPND